MLFVAVFSRSGYVQRFKTVFSITGEDFFAHILDFILFSWHNYHSISKVYSSIYFNLRINLIAKICPAWTLMNQNSRKVGFGMCVLSDF